MLDSTIREGRVAVLAAALAAAVGLLPVLAQVQTKVPDVIAGARPAIAERIRIHGTELEGNLEGNAVDRDAIVFLPPTYNQSRTRRYPVVYALHGYSIGAEQWAKEIHVPQTIEGAFASGAREMIVVLPDAKTVHNGSMYSSSVTTGDFENYVARDVVAPVDARYRTMPGRETFGESRRPHPAHGVVMSLGRTQTALGAFYRRLAARIGKPQAITATARKLAILVYRALTGALVYRDIGADGYSAHQRARVLNGLRRRANTLGFDLLDRHTGEVLDAARA